MRLLITGGTGRLGRALCQVFPEAWSPAHQELDVTSLASVEYFLKHHPPDVVIHAAALTDVRRCEEDRQTAWRVNVLGTEQLLRVAAQVQPRVFFIYISTAGVFDGRRGDYSEEDIPCPINFYCFTKYVGEERVRLFPSALIIRTNFVLRDPWPHPCAFLDRWGTYLFADVAVGGIREMMEAGVKGIVHLCGDRKISMFEIAKKTRPDVRGMTLKGYNGPALARDLSLVSRRWKTYRLED